MTAIAEQWCDTCAHHTDSTAADGEPPNCTCDLVEDPREHRDDRCCVWWWDTMVTPGCAEYTPRTDAPLSDRGPT